MELDRKNKQLEQFQEQLLEEKSGRLSQHEHVQLRFENRQKELEEEQRGRVASMELKLANKEGDMYKMEQLILKLNHQIDQANSERDVAKADVEMRTIDKITAEEQSKYLRLQHDELKTKALQQSEEFDQLMTQRKLDAFKADAANK